MAKFSLSLMMLLQHMMYAVWWVPLGGLPHEPGSEQYTEVINSEFNGPKWAGCTSTCILLGNNDPLIPFESAVKFGEAVKNSGGEFYVFEGKGHGLFSQKESELTEPIMKTHYHWHSFLYKQGYVNKPRKLRSDYSIVVSKYKFDKIIE